MFGMWLDQRVAVHTIWHLGDNERLLLGWQFFRPLAIFRRLLLIGLDALILSLAVWLSCWLRWLIRSIPTCMYGSWLLLAVLLVGLPLYAFTGQYKGLTRYVEVQRYIVSPAETDCWCFCWLPSV